MVTLATAVNANATTWALSEALPAGTEYIQVDDELVAVITPAIRPSQREPETLFCEVLRGAAGEQSSHAQGATLTTLENPPLGGGGLQTVRLLGPFHFEHDTPLLMDPADFGADVGTIPAGSTFQGFVVITEGFNQPGELVVNASVDGLDGSVVEIASYNPPDALNTSGDEIMREPFRPDGRTLGWLLTNIEAHIVVGFYPSGSTPTTGEGDVYALIAQPA